MSAYLKVVTLNKPSLLLCEGEDEVNFFSAWLSELGLTDVQPLAYQGKTKLSEFLSDLPKISGSSQVKRIAITRDADEDASAALESVNHIIQQAPSWVQAFQPPIFVLPGNGRSGALESIWLASLVDDPKAACVEDFFRCIQEKGWEPSQIFAKNDKARAQLWIASKDVPNERFGIAPWHGRRNTDRPWMKEKWVNFEHPAFDELRQFLITAFKQ